MLGDVFSAASRRTNKSVHRSMGVVEPDPDLTQTLMRVSSELALDHVTLSQRLSGTLALWHVWSGKRSCGRMVACK